MQDTHETQDLHHALPREDTLPLLRHLPDLGSMTCVILHGGCVFEFTGAFPDGAVSEGYYNLRIGDSGFHGHLAIKAMTRVRFQERPHRGRPSYAFVFENDEGKCLFKAFLGRDAHGAIFPEQLNFFRHLQQQGTLTPQLETA